MARSLAPPLLPQVYEAWQSALTGSALIRRQGREGQWSRVDQTLYGNFHCTLTKGLKELVEVPHAGVRHLLALSKLLRTDGHAVRRHKVLQQAGLALGYSHFKVSSFNPTKGWLR